jgi:surfeit locus 1 family protein
VNLRYRRLLIPGLSTLAMLAVLLGLGTWQVERLFWKEAILARIDQAEAAPPVPLAGHAADFTKVAATGHFRPGVIGYYGSQSDPSARANGLGAQQLAVLERPGAPALLVDRGWVPLPADPHLSPPAGETTVQGYVRPGETPGPFSATDDPREHRFYTLDPPAIAHALGLPAVAPFVLIAMGTPTPGHYPLPADSLPRPPNNHRNYAITWFGLAACLLVIFTLHARKVLKA